MYFLKNIKSYNDINNSICDNLYTIAGFFGTQAILSAGRAKDVKLPNLVGKTIEEAEQELKKQN